MFIILCRNEFLFIVFVASFWEEMVERIEEGDSWISYLYLNVKALFPLLLFFYLDKNTNSLHRRLIS